jgi:hypothetical protein
MFKCSTCPIKITKIKYWCIQCKQCSNCCECVCLNFVEHKLKFYQASEKDRKLNSSGRFIAAEIEIAGTKKANTQAMEEVGKALQRWSCSCVEDGSLPYCGFEINTSPANGDLFVKQINEIATKLKAAGPIITKDCGLHIHIDARDYNFYDIAKLIKVYAAIEPVLFMMVPAHRRKSKFCLPCGQLYKNAIASDTRDTYFAKKTSVVFGTYNNYDSNANRKSKYNAARYNALNLHSWFYRGTIEFRLIEGTVDPDYIINWGMLWANLLDWTLQATDKEVDKALVKLNSTGATDMLDNMIGFDLVEFIIAQLKKNKVKKPKSKKKPRR